MKEKTSNFIDKIHFYGGVWSISALVVMLLVPIAMSVYFKTWPKADEAFIAAILSIVPLYWGTGIIEIIAYVPMLGAAGTYLSFVTGNIANLKLPCGLSAMEKAKVAPNTEEGEVISTIAIGVSSVTTTAIIAIGVLAFSPLFIKLLASESALNSAFKYVLPALFGALGATYFAKQPRVALPTIAIGVLILIFKPTLVAGTLIFPTIIVAVLSAIFSYMHDNGMKPREIGKLLKGFVK